MTWATDVQMADARPFSISTLQDLSNDTRTPQCEVFGACCRGLNIRESRRTPNPQFFQVLGFTPTLGQVRVATVGMGRDVGRFMLWCDVVTWSAIIWDMWNVIKGKRHWNYFNCCNKVCKQIYFLLKYFMLEYWMHVLVSLHLKRVVCCLWVDYLNVVANSLVDMYMQNMGTCRMFGWCSTNAIQKCGDLDWMH